MTTLDDFGDEALAQPEQERCVGCEACIDTACGRDECPKGWPKATQPAQEPVAFFVYDPRVQSQELYFDDELGDTDCCEITPLYTTPQQRTWVGLTDDEIDKAWRTVDYTVPYEQFRIDVAKAIEAKLKEKNT